MHLCAGDGLREAANLVQFGIPEADGQVLANRLAEAEAALHPAHVALFSLFDGTMIVEEDLFEER